MVGAPAALGVPRLHWLEEPPTSSPVRVRRGRRRFDAVQYEDCHPTSEASSGSGEASRDAESALAALTLPSPEPI